MLKKRPRASMIMGGCILGVIFLAVLIGLIYTPYDPNAMSGLEKNIGPSLSHIFGTDNFGRDIFSRVIVGARNTIYVALLTVTIGTIGGSIIGLLSGFYGGWFDEIVMRLNDGLTAFPSILLALVFISVLGPGMNNLIAALSIVFIPSFARIMRSECLRIKGFEYISAAKVLGVSDFRILVKHILPNTTSTLVSSIAIGFTNAVLAESSMSYLGLGVQPPTASLGRMLSESQSFLFHAPWYAIAPGMTIVLIALGASLFSEGVRDYFMQ